jgi:hypothetical protein
LKKKEKEKGIKTLEDKPRRKKTKKKKRKEDNHIIMM